MRRPTTELAARKHTGRYKPAVAGGRLLWVMCLCTHCPPGCRNPTSCALRSDACERSTKHHRVTACAFCLLARRRSSAWACLCAAPGRKRRLLRRLFVDASADRQLAPSLL
jgi:hypothetical protein